MYPALRYLMAGCGWLLVLFEWIHVSHGAPARQPLTLLLLLIPSLVVLHAAATTWIAHCKRVAARGKRGLITRYTSPAFSQDHFGRRLIMNEKSLRSKEIDISIDGDVKSYNLAADASIGSGEVEVHMDGDSKPLAPASEIWR